MLTLASLGCLPFAMPDPREGESLECGERWQRLPGLRLPVLSFILFFSSPLCLPLFLCSQRFLALLGGISHSGYLWGTQPCYLASPASDPGSRQHLVLLSPESLFNIISFLLTFIKTNIELRRVYTPTRDTLHFDIKNKRKQNLNSPNLRPRGERERREKGGKKKEKSILEIFLPSKIRHSLLHITDMSTISSSYNSP